MREKVKGREVKELIMRKIEGVKENIVSHD